SPQSTHAYASLSETITVMSARLVKSSCVTLPFRTILSTLPELQLIRRFPLSCQGALVAFVNTIEDRSFTRLVFRVAYLDVRKSHVYRVLNWRRCRPLVLPEHTCVVSLKLELQPARRLDMHVDAESGQQVIVVIARAKAPACKALQARTEYAAKVEPTRQLLVQLVRWDEIRWARNLLRKGCRRSQQSKQRNHK